jgi:hypothetical protein
MSGIKIVAKRQFIKGMLAGLAGVVCCFGLAFCADRMPNLTPIYWATSVASVGSFVAGLAGLAWIWSRPVACPKCGAMSRFVSDTKTNEWLFRCPACSFEDSTGISSVD